MARVFVSSVIGAPAAKVWERVRDFNGMPRWHPGIRESRIENAEPADKIGCVRDFRLQNGDRIRERLLGLSDYDMTCTYAILESPMPLTNYVATLRLTPISDGDRCFVEWTADFDCAIEVHDDLVGGIGQNVFQAGFDSLKRHFGTGEDAPAPPLLRAPSGRRPMVKIVKSTVIAAPVEPVWEVLRDFNGHDRWHPAVSDSQIERGQPVDRIGCVRRFHLADGSELREQLLALSDLDMAFSYCLLDTPIPLLNYVAHVRLVPVTDGDMTFWHWSSRFDTPAGREAELEETVGRNIYEAGFEAVRRHLGLPTRAEGAP